MSRLRIEDLPVDETLDQAALGAVRGGLYVGDQQQTRYGLPVPACPVHPDARYTVPGAQPRPLPACPVHPEARFTVSDGQYMYAARDPHSSS